MKTKNIVITLLVAACATLASMAFAGDHPAKLPQIQSQDRLRSYALSIAAQGGRYVYSSSMDWTYTNTVNSTSTNGSSGEDILNKVFSVPFRYRIINPNDQVSATAYLYDTNQNLLFYGYGSAIAKNLSLSNGIQTSLWMQEIPILSDVSEANVLVLGQDGQTADTIQARLSDSGQLLWPPWLSGYTNAIVWVKYKDGTVTSYNLANPVASSPSVTYETDGYSVDGHYQNELPRPVVLRSRSSRHGLCRAHIST